MKKLLILFLFMSLAFAMSAQTWVTLNCTTANDSLTGAQTKYYTLTKPLLNSWASCIVISLAPSDVTNGGDSTHAYFEGSINNSTWYKVDMGTPSLGGAAIYYTSNASTIASGYVHRMRTTAAASWFFLPLNDSPPYLRLVIQHFVAVKVMKAPLIAKVYLKK